MRPENIFCRAQRFPDTPLDQLGQTVTCNVSSGLICYNKDQTGFMPVCYNYEIKVYCCRPLPDFCLSTLSTTTTTTSPTTTSEITTASLTTTTSETTTISPTTTSETTTTSPTTTTSEITTTSPTTTTSEITTTAPTITTSEITTASITTTTSKTTTTSPTTTTSETTTPSPTTTTSVITSTPEAPTSTTTETTTTTTTTTSVCDPYCTWSQWFDVSYPKYEPNGGDFETYKNITNAGFEVCKESMRPENISCRAQKFPDMPLDQLGQTVTCDVSTGLICYNKDQTGFMPVCYNYEISVYCCSLLPDFCYTTVSTTTSPTTTTSESTTTSPTTTTSETTTTSPTTTTSEITTTSPITTTSEITTTLPTTTTSETTTISPTTTSETTTVSPTTTTSKTTTTSIFTSTPRPQNSTTAKTTKTTTVTTNQTTTFPSVSFRTPAPTSPITVTQSPIEGATGSTSKVTVTSHIPPSTTTCTTEESVETTPITTTEVTTTAPRTPSTTTASTTTPTTVTTTTITPSTTHKSTTIYTPTEIASTTETTTASTTTSPTTTTTTTTISETTTLHPPTESTTASTTETTTTSTTTSPTTTTTTITPTTTLYTPTESTTASTTETTTSTSTSPTTTSIITTTPTTSTISESTTLYTPTESTTASTTETTTTRTTTSPTTTSPTTTSTTTITPTSTTISESTTIYIPTESTPSTFETTTTIKSTTTTPTPSPSTSETTTENPTPEPSTSSPATTTSSTSSVTTTPEIPTTSETTIRSSTVCVCLYNGVSYPPGEIIISGVANMTWCYKVICSLQCKVHVHHWPCYSPTTSPPTPTPEIPTESTTTETSTPTVESTTTRETTTTPQGTPTPEIPTTGSTPLATTTTTESTTTRETTTTPQSTSTPEIPTPGSTPLTTTMESTTRETTTTPQGTPTPEIPTTGSTPLITTTTTESTTTREKTTTPQGTPTPEIPTTGSTPLTTTTTTESTTTRETTTIPQSTSTPEIPTPGSTPLTTTTTTESTPTPELPTSPGSTPTPVIITSTTIATTRTPEPTSTTKPTTKSTITKPTISKSTALSTTKKPGCPFEPHREHNETWILCNCTMARCLENNTVEIIELKCEPPPEIKCANGRRPRPVPDDDLCCWHWECDCLCTGWGDPHYVTFDGTYYSFQGNCTYTLVEEIQKRIDNFGIYIDNYDCGAKDRVSCPRDIIVQHETQLIRIKAKSLLPISLEVVVNDEIVGTPYKKYGVKVYRSGINYVVEIPELEANITYNGLTFSVSLPYRLFGHNTQGQCGTCTNDRSDDCMLPNGTIISNCEVMADSWVVADPRKPQCGHLRPTIPPKVTVPTTPCTPSPLCDLLLEAPFKECHKTVSPDDFYKACTYDSCHVPNSNIECSSLQHYALLCGDQGVCIEWRSRASECPITCPSHKVYNACGPAVSKTCATTPEEEALIKTNTRLVEGCFCPKGTMPFSQAVDVCVHTCGCVGPDNVPRKFGEVFEFDCQDCVCREGGSGITCQIHECKALKQVTCELEGFYPEIEISSTDSCCNETVCKCDTQLCSSKSPNCDLGYEIVGSIPDGHCCPVYTCVRKNVCVHGNAEYMPGAPVFSDNCQSCVCAQNDSSLTGPQITCTHVPCNVQCSMGFELKQSPKDCCGVCEQTHCVLSQGGTYKLMRPGEMVHADNDNCTLYSCTVIRKQFITSVSQISCPFYDEEQCESGTTITLSNGCCKICIEKSSSCHLQISYDFMVYNNCRSESTVKTSRCDGACGTFSMYSAEDGGISHKCTCCQEVQTSQRSVTLQCPDGSKVQHEYIDVEQCNCVKTDCGHGTANEDQTPVRARRSARRKVARLN